MGDRARVALFKSVSGAMERLPESFDVWIGRHVASVVGRRSAAARAGLAANLRVVLGDQVDARLLERFVDRGFDGYGRYWAEGAKLPAIPPATVVDPESHVARKEREELLRDAILRLPPVFREVVHLRQGREYSRERFRRLSVSLNPRSSQGWRAPN